MRRYIQSEQSRKHRSGAQIEIMSAPCGRRLQENSFGLGLVHVGGEDGDDCLRHLILHLEGILQFSIIVFGPAMTTGSKSIS